MLTTQTEEQKGLPQVLAKLINSLRLLKNLQSECAELVKQDCVVLRT